MSERMCKQRRLKELYEQCVDSQQRFFCQLYGEPDTIDSKRLSEAIRLCERTIKKNNAPKVEEPEPKVEEVVKTLAKYEVTARLYGRYTQRYTVEIEAHSEEEARKIFEDMDVPDGVEAELDCEDGDETFRRIAAE